MGAIQNYHDDVRRSSCFDEALSLYRMHIFGFISVVVVPFVLLSCFRDFVLLVGAHTLASPIKGFKLPLLSALRRATTSLNGSNLYLWAVHTCSYLASVTMWALQGFVSSRDLDRVRRSRVSVVHDNRDDEAGYGGQYILLSHP